MNKSSIVSAILVGLLGFSSHAHAQTTFDKPLTLVVGYSAGGSVDSFARAIAKQLSEKLKQSVVVENRDGASEMLATQHVAKSKPDGYTLLVSTEAPLTQNQFLYKKLGYSPEKDLLPVSIMVQAPMALAISPQFPADTFDKFLAEAKSRKENTVKFASSGVGGITHLPVAMLATKEKFDWVHVPYKGFAKISPDLVTGRVDATVTAVNNVLPFHKDNRMRIIAVGSDERLKSLPNIPTFKELNLGDLKAQYLMILSAPAGTPSVVAQQLAAAVNAIVTDNAFQERFLDPYALVPVGSTSEEAALYVENDRPVQRERIKISGASLQ